MLSITRSSDNDLSKTMVDGDMEVTFLEKVNSF